MQRKQIISRGALPFLSVLLASFFFSAKGILIKLCYPFQIGADELQFWRQIVSLPFFLIIATWTIPAQKKQFISSDWWRLPLLGVIGYYLASWFDFLGLKHISAGLERMVIYSYPTFVVLIGILLRGRSLVPRQIAALALAYVGIGVFYWSEISLNSNSLFLGFCQCLISAILFAIFLSLGEGVVKRLGTLPFTSICMIFATLGTSCHQAFLHGAPSLDHPMHLWILIALLGTMGTVVPSIATYWGMSKLGAERAAVLAMIGPLCTLVLSVFILGDTLNLYKICGAALILFGVLRSTQVSAQKPNFDPRTNRI